MYEYVMVISYYFFTKIMRFNGNVCFSSMFLKVIWCIYYSHIIGIYCYQLTVVHFNKTIDF